jgi:hypothetical protein
MIVKMIVMMDNRREVQYNVRYKPWCGTDVSLTGKGIDFEVTEISTLKLSSIDSKTFCA